MLKEYLRGIYERILADSESKSGPDGYLSYRAEWHSAAWGFAAAFFAFAAGQPWLLTAAVGWVLTAKNARDAPGYIPYPRQFLKESAYLFGHGIVGAVLGTAAHVYLL